jgi:pimeloyl-ACP methyl ester carboxylesterase
MNSALSRRLALLVALASSACVAPRPYEARPPVARLYGGQVGWFQVEPTLKLDSEGNPLLPGLSAADLREDNRVSQLLMRAYGQQFAPVKLGSECPTAPADRRRGPVLVLVHGIGGDGLEWVPVVPTLAALDPVAIYMYRWFFPRERGELLDGLVNGLQALAACYPEAKLELVAHSAGGVLSSFAASRIALPEHSALRILTVASPLAGSGMRTGLDVEDDNTRFLMHLGGVIPGYPEAAARVSVVHLRTQWPADSAMKPNSAGYSPNDPSAVVKGARLVELPDTVDHDTSLLHVARELVAGKL